MEETGRQDAVNWWIEKQRFDRAAYPLWDEEVTKRTYIGLPWHMKKFVSKWTTKQLPLGKRQVQLQMSTSMKCPRCDEIESIDHVLQCPLTSAQARWLQHMREFDRWLRSIHTDP